MQAPVTAAELIPIAHKKKIAELINRKELIIKHATVVKPCRGWVPEISEAEPSPIKPSTQPMTTCSSKNADAFYWKN